MQLNGIEVEEEKRRIVETLWPIAITGIPNNEAYARDVCTLLEEKYFECSPIVFQDSERAFQNEGNLREREVFIICSTEQPDANIMNTLFMAHNAKVMSSAHGVTVLFTYFGYARGDRKDKPGKSVPAATICTLLKAVNVDRVIILDPHFSQLQSILHALNIKCDLLFATEILANRIIKEEKLENAIISTVDSGGLKIVKDYSARLGAPFVIALKDKSKEGELKVIGSSCNDIEDSIIIIGDDLTATLTSITETATTYKKLGARRVIASLTHFACVDSNRDLLLERLDNPAVDKYYATDSLSLPSEILEHPKYVSVTSKELIAKAIFNTYYRLSISQLFALDKEKSYR